MNNMDDILKSVLATEYKSPQYINNMVLRTADEKGTVKMKKNFKFKRVLAALALIMCCAVPTYAAIRFLTPAQVVQHVGNSAVAKAFESKDAIAVNETQYFEEYNVTLLGLVSGKTLEETDVFDNEELLFDRTYCVIAVENADGSAITDMMEAPSFCVSPFIKGYHPGIVNVMTLNGNYRDIVLDGVCYRVMNCENIEVFADTTVYLGVNEGLLPEWSAFSFNETTGEINRTEDFKGVNALFELPFDSTKANSEKAQKIISEILPE